MADPTGEENYYQLLKVDPRATVAEIVSAYHTAKNAFSKDSVATYSLFSPEEAESMLSKLEEAYLTLSNLDRRAEYDRHLTQPSEPLRPQKAPANDTLDGFEMGGGNARVESAPSPTQSMAPSEEGAPTTASSAPLVGPEECSGAGLRDIRTRRGLSLEDVARITKIPSKFIRSLEDDDFKRLPARVYIQGFIKNMAVLYRIDPKTTVKSYLAYLDRAHPTT